MKTEPGTDQAPAAPGAAGETVAGARAEEGLRESERYRFLADSMPQMVFMAAGNGRLNYHNRRWLDYTGQAVGTDLSVIWKHLAHPDDRDAALAGWSRSVRSGIAYEAEMRIRGAESEYRWHLVRATAMRDRAGAVVLWAGTCTDIDDQKRAEAELEGKRLVLGTGTSSGGQSPRSGTTAIGLLGAKGGAGTTTVALNVACVLGKESAAVLGEIGNRNDTLALHLRTLGSVRPGHQTGPPLFETLWSVDQSPGVHLGFAQDLCVSAELDTLAGLARYLVLDLGSAITDVTRSILPQLDALALVLDRDGLSLECAARLLSVLRQPALHPRGRIGAVVVSRTSLACPVNVEEVQRALGIPVFGAVPPAADLCQAAQKARCPLVRFDPESLAAESLIRIACSFQP